MDCGIVSYCLVLFPESPPPSSMTIASTAGTFLFSFFTVPAFAPSSKTQQRFENFDVIVDLHMPGTENSSKQRSDQDTNTNPPHSRVLKTNDLVAPNALVCWPTTTTRIVSNRDLSVLQHVRFCTNPGSPCLSSSAVHLLSPSLINKCFSLTTV